MFQAQVQVKKSPRKDFCAYLPLKQLSQALFFVERIASYACRVGLDLPSSYVRLEWELDGFDGPISYYIVLYCAVLYID